jgi:peptide/nickel transport system substrate-binding protein
VVETEGETVVETVEVIVEVEPTPEPVTRTGAWVDTVIMVEEPNSDSAVTRLLAGDLDVYAYNIAEAPIAERIYAEDSLSYYKSYGNYNDLTFNPVLILEDGSLNPFGDPQIREAMNWLVDRDYISQEITGGMSQPRYVPINLSAADQANFADVIAEMATKYAHNPEKADEVISERMVALGAEKVDDIWTYEGEPVELVALIRIEDERLEIGDYVSNLLEGIGFTVTRDYKTSAEASTCWISSVPESGCFHFYTGGWVSTAISRDEGTNFGFFYTGLGYGVPLWQAYENTEEFYDVSLRLWNNDFKTYEERSELFRQAIPLALEDSARIWLKDDIGVSPQRAEISVASDLSASVYGAWLWGETLRIEDTVGGSVTIGMPSLLTQPINPVGGSNWVYDMMPARGVAGKAVIPDPYTGLTRPNRLQGATVFAVEGLPIGKTYDWVGLEFVDEIAVPADAWADWDAVDQVFIPAGEGVTAQTKVEIVYEDGFPGNMTWHDGSPLGPADMVMGFIMAFDRAKEDSPIFDEAYVSDFAAFISSFKGLKITSLDPVTIEYYTDAYALDAENNVSNFRALYPNLDGLYDRGSAAWHNIVPAWLAESEGLVAWTDSKAAALEVDQANYLGGPTLEIMAAKLAEAKEAALIPYEPTLGEFITAEEAVARYENLETFIESFGHMYIGTGPFYIQRAFPVEGTLILQRYPSYPDMADKWAIFGVAPIPEVLVDGPGEVAVGDEAVFDAFIDFAGEPYAIADLSMVTYLVFDATGALVMKGDAEAVDDGYYTVTLDTSELPAGSNKLAVTAVSKNVLLPVTFTFEFVTAE